MTIAVGNERVIRGNRERRNRAIERAIIGLDHTPQVLSIILDSSRRGLG
jgi:hypothetical protein